MLFVMMRRNRNMQVVGKWTRILARIVWGLVCLLLMVVFLMDLRQFSQAPELYPIGAEGLGWTYESAPNYVLSGWLLVGWGVIGALLALLYRVRNSGLFLLIHALMTLLWVGYVAWYAY